MTEIITSRIELIPVRTLIESLEEGYIMLGSDADEVGRDIPQEDRQDFIVSLMAGMPVLPFVLDGTDRPWKVLDGEKRLALIWAFFAGKFPIKGSSYFIVGGEKYFEELPPFKQRKFMSTKIPCYVINPPTSQDAVYYIKKRINRAL